MHENLQLSCKVKSEVSSTMRALAGARYAGAMLNAFRIKVGNGNTSARKHSHC